MNPTFINTKMTALAACICQNVEGADGFCFCGVMPGDSWYDMTTPGEDTGQAWVRLANMYPATNFGEPDTSLSNCTKGTGIELEIGVIRCFEIPDNGENPSQELLLELLDKQVIDAGALRTAVECCEHFEDYSLGVWSPIGPLGGIYGGVWTLTAQVF